MRMKRRQAGPVLRCPHERHGRRRPMTPNKMRWLLVGLVCLALWSPAGRGRRHRSTGKRRTFAPVTSVAGALQSLA